MDAFTLVSGTYRQELVAATGRVAKMAEYAEAGIPNYWIIDVDGEVTIDLRALRP